MFASQIPVKFTIPFANGAGASFITSPLPVASQIGISGGRASLTDGFPPLNFQPVGGGGIAPWGADMNGILNQITAWCRWTGAGGRTTFDATFSAAIGGYPAGALLQSASAGNMWVSLSDNNTVNPDTTPGSPGWAAVAFVVPIQNGSYVSGDDTGSADNYVVAPQPPPTAYAKYQKFRVKIAHTNLTNSPLLNVVGVGGLLGAQSIVHYDGTSVARGEIAAGMVADFVYDGTRFQFERTAIPHLQFLEATGNGQFFSTPNISYLITCFTTITNNTLVTSTWNGNTFTCGAGEDGLWSIYSFMEVHGIGGTFPTFNNLGISRNRAGVNKTYAPTGTSVPQPNNHIITDLQVGDTVQFTYGFGGDGISFTAVDSAGVPNISLYRIEGLQ